MPFLCKFCKFTYSFIKIHVILYQKEEVFMKEQHILEGNISIKAALLSGNRKVHKIIVDKKKNDKDTNFILKEAKKRNIEIIYKDRASIDALSSGKTHGGFIAYCGDRKFQTLEQLLCVKNCFLAFIEGIEDPFNFGYILRTLYAAGCTGVIIPPRNWTTAASVVAKASAGASEHIPMFIADDISYVINELKQHEISLLCGHRENAIALYDFIFPNKFCIAIGGEMRGLSKQIMQQSDQNIFIPYNQEFRNALNAASATAVFAFEAARQRYQK